MKYGKGGLRLSHPYKHLSKKKSGATQDNDPQDQRLNKRTREIMGMVIFISKT